LSERSTRLEVRAADGVDHSERRRDGGEEIDPPQVLLGAGEGVALFEVEAPQPKLPAAHEERGERAPVRARDLHPHRRQHLVQDRQPSIEVPAEEELLGGASLQVERLVGGGPLGGGEERLRRLRAPARVHQRDG
jgi:hypothetical protein